MNKSFSHISVMSSEIMAFFNNKPGQILVDATAGGGGHLLQLAELSGVDSKILAFDKDLRAHEMDAAGGVKKAFAEMIELIHAPFSSIKSTLKEHGILEIDGLICDLGVSSEQLSDNTRGFSFLHDGPIDMRMDSSMPMTAFSFLENTSEKDIADTLYNFGGERKSRAIARLIKKRWPIENSTLALASLIASAIKQKSWSKIHPATRSFQAIRMAVNNEFSELESLLNDLPDLLAVNGVAVFLSFHSVEDRLIKQAFKKMVSNQDPKKSFAILTKKPLTASDDELNNNKRSRSAKLRAIKRIA